MGFTLALEAIKVITATNSKRRAVSYIEIVDWNFWKEVKKNPKLGTDWTHIHAWTPKLIL